MIKKLLVIAILAGLAYGAWKYLEQIQQTTAERSDQLKPSEKALKEEMAQ